jgi:hypothetical protein
MKNLKLILPLCYLFFLSTLHAQVSEKETTMSLGSQNALVVELEGSDSKTAENVWKEFVKEYGKVKKNKKAKEFYMEQTNIPAISGNANCDVYTKFEERARVTLVYFWVDMGDSFLSSSNNEEGYNGADVLLTEYGYAVQKHLITKELEEEKKRLKNLEKDMSKLVKSNKNYHKEIEEATEKIRKAEINIEKNEVAQTNKNEEIVAMVKMVSEIEERLKNVGKPAAVKIESMEKEEGSKEDKGKEKEDKGGKK